MAERSSVPERFISDMTVPRIPSSGKTAVIFTKSEYHIEALQVLSLRRRHSLSVIESSAGTPSRRFVFG